MWHSQLWQWSDEWWHNHMLRFVPWLLFSCILSQRVPFFRDWTTDFVSHSLDCWLATPMTGVLLCVVFRREPLPWHDLVCVVYRREPLFRLIICCVLSTDVATPMTGVLLCVVYGREPFPWLVFCCVLSTNVATPITGVFCCVLSTDVTQQIISLKSGSRL